MSGEDGMGEISIQYDSPGIPGHALLTEGVVCTLLLRTSRTCLLGDPGCTQLCTNDDCSLCNIIRSSFDLDHYGTGTGWGRFASTSSYSSHDTVLRQFALFMLGLDADTTRRLLHLSKPVGCHQHKFIALRMSLQIRRLLEEQGICYHVKLQDDATESCSYGKSIRDVF